MMAREIRGFRPIVSPLLMSALALALPAHADEDPSFVRGLEAPTTYELNDIDAVNVFNGALSVAIPIGIEYPVGPSLSYRLVLHYNSNFWTYEEIEMDGDPTGCQGGDKPEIDTRSDQRSNAGLGWTLSFGRLIHENIAVEPCAGACDRWRLVEPDGTVRVFYDENGLTGADRRIVTRDGSYLRLNPNDGHRRVEAPDGSFREYQGSVGRLSRMQDAHGNWMAINYSTSPNVWTITDNHARTHYVYSVDDDQRCTGSTPCIFQRITSVDLQAFNNQRAVYSFDYGGGPRMVDKPKHFECTNGCNPGTEAFWLLDKLHLPSGATFDPAYQLAVDPKTGNLPPVIDGGELRQLLLPTGGGYQWDYDEYPPISACPQLLIHAVRGVSAKRMVDSTGNLDVSPPTLPGVVGQPWVYQGQCTRDDVRMGESIRCVTTPEGNETVYVFDGRDSSGSRGLPFSPEELDEEPGGRPLTRLEFEGDQDGTLLRKHYARYANASETGGGPAGRQIISERTVFVAPPSGGFCTADKMTQIDRSAFVLGKWGTVTETSDFDDSEDRSTTTTYSTTQAPTDPNAAWLLTNYEQISTTQGTDTYVQDFCFDGNGFLERARQRAGSSPGDHDLIQVFSDNGVGDGFSRSASYYGGDDQTVGNDPDLCTMGLGSPESTVSREYQFGALKSTTLAGGMTTRDYDIDQSTGLVSVSRDVAGLPTTVSYDLLGRVAEADPPGADVKTTINYCAATYGPCASQGNRATSTRNGAGQNDEKSVRIFDEWGRLQYENVRRPELNESTGAYGFRDAQRSFLYNNSGWQTEARDWKWASAVIDPGEAARTVTESFDAYGRPTRIVPPEGSDSATEIEYCGTHQVKRTNRIAASVAPTGSNTPHGLFNVGQQDSVTIETYDAAGRLVKIENDHSIGEYDYDPAGQLTDVRVTDKATSNTQDREFAYDGRGFLVSEAHPELGWPADPNGKLTYGYDSRGQMVTRSDRRYSIDYQYDDNQRLERMFANPGTESSYGGLLKVFRYFGGSGPQSRRHRLKRAVRVNPRPGSAPDVAVGEDYLYDGSGRVAQKVTFVDHSAIPSLIEPGQGVGGDGVFDPTDVFVSTYAYNNLGGLAVLSYPCRSDSYDTDSPDWSQGCNSNENPRAVYYDYVAGSVSKVSETLHGGLANTVLDRVQYHPSGLMASHSYGGTGTSYHVDPGRYYTEQSGATDGSRTSRPVAIYLNDDQASSEFARYDGVGNVSQMGDAAFQYDTSSRLTRAYYKDYTGGVDHHTTFEYDGFGNRLRIRDIAPVGGGNLADVLVDPATNRLDDTEGYDLAGNLASQGDFTWSWDPLGQLMELQQVSAALDWSYLYTADDERIQSRYKIANPVWRLRDLGGRPLREFVSRFDQGDDPPPDPAECSTQTTYFDDDWESADLSCWDNVVPAVAGVSGGPLPDDFQRDWIYSGGRVVSVFDNWGGGPPQELHTNLRGDISKATQGSDNNGDGVPDPGSAVMLGSYRLSPFGRQLQPHPNDPDPINSPLLFTGHERDHNAPNDVNDDLDYMHARYYSPNDGRFLSLDPINSARHSFPETWNRYIYARNNPLRFIDRDGREEEEWRLVAVIDNRVPPSPIKEQIFLDLASATPGLMRPAAGPARTPRTEMTLPRSTSQPITFGESGRRLDFLFNRNINQQNKISADRARGNGSVMTRAGIADNPANRRLITSRLTDAVDDPRTLIKSSGGSNLREIVVKGPRGDVIIQFWERGRDIRTFIAKLAR